MKQRLRWKRHRDRSLFPGKELQVYGSAQGTATVMGILGIVSLGFGVLCLALAGVAFYRPNEGPSDPVGITYLGVILLALGAGSLVIAARRWGSQLIITDQGVGVARVFSKPAFFAWQEIVSVREECHEDSQSEISNSTETEYRLRIRTDSGRSTLLSSFFFPDLPSFAPVIQREVARILLPDLRRRMRQGDTVEFGPLRLSERGLRIDGDLYRWDEIDEVVRRGAFVVIWGPGRSRSWGRVLLRDVPNLHALRILVEDQLEDG